MRRITLAAVHLALTAGWVEQWRASDARPMHVYQYSMRKLESNFSCELLSI